jgi:hypothetical protein
MNGPSPPPVERYLGVDLHRHYLVIGGVNARQAQACSHATVSIYGGFW